MLIEVMVGALLLGMATTAILNGLDGAQAVEKKNKIRSVQSTLAQQDIERMRSMPVTSLTNLNQTRTVTVAGVNYTVLSTTTWISDATGQVSCSDPNAGAEYLKLSSKVTSPGSKNNVTETALLSPGLGQLNASLGLATVKLVDRNGAPLAGKTVNLSGASSQTKTTNSLGCAVFGYIPAGSYTASVPCCVEMDSNGTANEPLMVYKGRASFGQMQVDVPASIRATFVGPSGNTTTPASAFVWDSITVKNGNLVGAKKTFVQSTGKVHQADAGGLFPFLDGVGVYAGNCDANDPINYQANYFSPPGPRGFTNLDPGDSFRGLNVEMPVVKVTVYRTNTTTNMVYAEVKLTPTDTNCTTTASATFTFSSAGTPANFEIPVPYVSYTVCAANRSSIFSSTFRKTTGSVTVKTIPAPATTNLTLTTSSTTGGCLP
jgi:hypothetical protein